MFSYVSLEERVPADHPLRAIRRLADQVLVEMKAEFDWSLRRHRAAIDSARAAFRALRATPHIIQNNAHRRSAIDGRTTRHVDYAISVSKRWLVENRSAG